MVSHIIQYAECTMFIMPHGLYRQLAVCLSFLCDCFVAVSTSLAMYTLANPAQCHCTGATNTDGLNLMQLAAKQRMNTDSRRAVFCALMSAEDYIDATEKLLALDLRQKDREITRVLVDCCMQVCHKIKCNELIDLFLKRVPWIFTMSLCRMT